MYAALPGKRTGAYHATTDTRMAPVHWTIVRSPYERAASIWASTCQRRGDSYKAKQLCGKDLSFENFVRVVLDKNAHKHRIFQCQHVHLQNALIDEYARIETLEEDVNRITGLKLNLPVKNKSESSLAEYTPETIEIINRWAHPDFIEYGYEKWNQ